MIYQIGFFNPKASSSRFQRKMIIIIKSCEKGVNNLVSIKTLIDKQYIMTTSDQKNASTLALSESNNDFLSLTKTLDDGSNSSKEKARELRRT